MTPTHLLWNGLSMKLRVGVIYGGRSWRARSLVVSAASIFKHLDRSRYEPVPIRSTRTDDGRWERRSRQRFPLVRCRTTDL